MRGETIRDFHSGGSLCRSMLDRSGVRWYLAEPRRYIYIGERVVAFILAACVVVIMPGHYNY